MSNLLNEKHALAKLRAELERRKGKLCRCCKKFRCYESLKKEQVSHVFKYLITNIKSYNVDEI